MAAPLKSRTFGGTEGVKAKGPINGPEPLKNDEDNLFAALNPNANFTTGEAGGLQENNLHASLVALIKSIATINGVEGDEDGNLILQAGTGIQIAANPENNIIQITATGGIAPEPHAITHIHGGTDPLDGTLDVDITGNAATATSATSATNAANVTTNINGMAISSIFEEDRVTVKEATHAESANSSTNANSATLAEAAKGDTRFQISGHYAGASSQIPANSNYFVQGFNRIIPAGKKLVIKRANYMFTSGAVRLKIYLEGQFTWLSSSHDGDESPDFELGTGNGTLEEVYIFYFNTSSTEVNASSGDGWWLDFAIE